MNAADLAGSAPVCPVEPPEGPAMGVGTRPTVSGQMSGSRATASEPPVHACPRCRAEVPVGVLYGPCAACRAERRPGGAPDEPEAER